MRASCRRPPVFLSVLALLIVWQLPAAGFQRSRDPYTKVCLRQPQRTLTFHLGGACPLGPSRQACLATVHDAVHAWNAPGCSDLHVRFAGQIPADRIGARRDWPRDGVNLIVFRHAAHPRRTPYANYSTVSYDRITGVIADADIVLDLVADRTSTADLYDILVHEIGHALGFDHALHPGAVMYRYHQPGPGRRNLSADDIRAICHVYPAGQPTPACRGPRRPMANLAGWRVFGPFLWWSSLLLASTAGWLLIHRRRSGHAGGRQSLRQKTSSR